jgi:hypothetical protein
MFLKINTKNQNLANTYLWSLKTLEHLILSKSIREYSEIFVFPRSVPKMNTLRSPCHNGFVSRSHIFLVQKKNTHL